MNAKEKLMAKLAQNQSRPKEDVIKNGMRYTDTHVYFFTDEAPFSNFYETPFSYKGFLINNSEKGFMLEKALTFDKDKAEDIVKAKTAFQAKKIGRQIRNYNDSLWNKIRYEKMKDVLRAKFSSSAHLKQILLDTGDRILVEGSPYDKIWGVGVDWKSSSILNQSNWQGQNLLGKALMDIRKELK